MKLEDLITYCGLYGGYVVAGVRIRYVLILQQLLRN